MRDNYNGHAGRNRREPNITQKDYLVLSMLSDLLKRSVSKYLTQNATILDLGCGEKPYQPFFLEKSAMYLGVDVRPSKFADIIASGEKLPFKDCSFSACLCTQVLEHVDEPTTAVKEIFRVLKPHGLLFLSTHGNWPVHGAPKDFWRWTEYGLIKMLTDFDFHIHEICMCGGSFTSVIQLLELYIPRRTLGIIAIVLLNKLGNLLDNFTWFDKKLPHLATNYFVVAEK